MGEIYEIRRHKMESGNRETYGELSSGNSSNEGVIYAESFTTKITKNSF
jgi:hypothetical protein